MTQSARLLWESPENVLQEEKGGILLLFFSHYFDNLLFSSGPLLLAHQVY